MFHSKKSRYVLPPPSAISQEGGLDPIPSPAKSAAAHGGDAKSAETPTSPRTPASLKAKDAMKAEASRYVAACPQLLRQLYIYIHIVH